MLTTIATLITAFATAILGVINLVLYLKDRDAEKIRIWLSYRQSLFEWYRRCNNILCDLKGMDLSFDERKPLLCDLSACIDEGRFYFPNIDNGDGHGKEKPICYQGYRDKTLDHLLEVYKICRDEKNYMENGKCLDEDACESIEDLRRDFNDCVESCLESKKFIRGISEFVKVRFDVQTVGKAI